MIPELGFFALIMALCLALAQSIIPLIGAQRRNIHWMAVAIPATRLHSLLLMIAFACLTYAFVTQDFTVAYVAQHSNIELPLYYRFSAVWAAHEGSLLLWVLILSFWSLAVTHFSRGLPMAFVARVLGVLGLISIGFLLFIIFTSNPFERLLPGAPDGHDLNPLLQDFGLIIHPPMLYMGYVGLSVPFAFAIAALLEGRIDAAWTRWARPWTLIAWVFLTLGIMLGSWWAYYELGWGGWWFWDPVENASFMPWLMATALIHSLAICEQRNAFKAWTVLLSIFGFSLSLLGTFLVRSGVLVSVHAFASDPARGIFILIFLGLVIGSALLLYAWRATAVSGGGQFSLVSRETLLLINNILLVSASGTILLGTLYPLILDGLNLGKISVGPPYFNKVFIPLMLPLVLLLGIGPLCKWKQDRFSQLGRQMAPAFVLSLILGGTLTLLAGASGTLMTAVGLAMALWVMLSAILILVKRLTHKKHKLKTLLEQPRSFIGMTLAHFGVGVFIVGITMVSAYQAESTVKMSPGDTETIADYTFHFDGVEEREGANYSTQYGSVRISKQGDEIAMLHPEKRVYRRETKPMTEAGIDAGLTRDLYVSLGEPLDATNNTWSLRLYYKPYIRWIWLGPILMAFGGFLAASDRRYRLPQTAAATQSAGIRQKATA